MSSFFAKPVVPFDFMRNNTVPLHFLGRVQPEHGNPEGVLAAHICQ